MSSKGKTALVTGAAGGLGRSIAEEFLAQGANVVICDINKELIADFNEKVASSHQDRTLVLESLRWSPTSNAGNNEFGSPTLGNITDDAAIDKLFAEVEKKFGALDILVNSAGMMDKFDPAGDVERGWWDRVIALNLTAPTMMTQRAVNAFLKAEKKGSIVNIASIAGFRGFTSGVAYTVSKHGLIGLTKNTAAFYASKGIRCNAIAAGAMQTNIAKEFMQGGLNMEGYMVMKKTFPDDSVFVETERIARLVSYLCSEEGSIFTGAVLTADGGVTAN